MASSSNGSEEKSSPQKLSPFVMWAQTEGALSFRINLQDVSEPKISTTSNTLEFSAYGIGANRGRNEYFFKFMFFKNINEQTLKVKKKDLEVLITIEKEDFEWWPRLTLDSFKPPWLKLDFDKLQTDDDEDVINDSDSYIDPDFRDLSSTMNRRKRMSRKSVQDFRKIYLLLYNLSQFVGFLYVLIVLTIQYSKEGPTYMEKAYEDVKTAFNFCQFLQILEFVHPLLGYTAGKPFLPFIQVMGRLVMIFGMIQSEPRIQSKPAVFYLLYTYALVEVIRYPYYMLRVYNVSISFITWLRYTVWIPLYPLGFLCEGIIILRNIPYFEETQKFSIFLPNAWNVSFYFPTVMRLYLLLGLFPLLYFMMTYMYQQRAKMLDKDKHLKKNF